MDWDELRYVLVVSRELTLSRAATRLGVSHTTVGRRIKALEGRLGVRLFDRTPEGFVPTTAGQDIARVAQEMEAEVLSLEGRVLGRDVRLEGELRVTTMDMLYVSFHEAFSSFSRRYQGINLTVVATDREASLTRREADVALRMTGTPPEHLVGQRVGTVAFAVYASRALAQRVGSGASYSDYPWLHWDGRLNMRWLDAFLARRAPGAQIAMRVDFSSLLMREAIAAGVGVHFQACFVADADPRLVRIGPVEEGFSRDLWLLTLRDLRHTGRVRAFMDHMPGAIRSALAALDARVGDDPS